MCLKAQEKGYDVVPTHVGVNLETVCGNKTSPPLSPRMWG